MLSGLKTYIVGALIVLFSVLYAVNLIDGETFLKILGILMGAGAITIRNAIAKVEKPQ